MADEDARKRTTAIVLVVVGFVSLLIVGLHAANGAQFGTALMCAAASMSVGTVVGFLFGIPKSGRGKGSDPQGEPKSQESRAQRPPLSPNTNLEEVSDWLTKIIVGVGLVEVEKIGAALERAAVSIATSMGAPVEAHKSYIVALLVFYLTYGFLTGYLVTRVFLSHLFFHADADLASLSDKIDDTAARISRHSEVESLIAQAEFCLREGKERGAHSFEGSKLLQDAEALFQFSIHIDEANIPAYIGLSKCYGAGNDYERALGKLEELERKLQKTRISAKSQARIDFNKACCYFRHAGKLGGHEKQAMIDKSFALLKKAVNAEEQIRVLARHDDDFEGARDMMSFKDIVGA